MRLVRAKMAASPERLTRSLPAAMLMAGIILLGYVATEYAQMHYEQQRLLAQWDRQNSAAGVTQGRVASPAVDLTRVSIPSIGFDAMVVEGTSNHQLLLGPGHLTNTPLPGQPGNAVISGHRDTFFRHIRELRPGDAILVRRGGRVYTYQVTGTRVVQPEDLSVISPTPDSELTLITCYPTYYIGPAPERLVVFSKLVKSSEATVPIASNGGS